MYEKDYTKCDVCGEDLGVDKMHVVIDNGRVTRHVYAHRHHRYVRVRVGDDTVVQTRTDLEVEALAQAFRSGALKVGWE